jgi:hypothetical protein
MPRPLRTLFRPARVAATAVLCAVALAVIAVGPDRPAAAQPRAGWRAELTYVPEDAAIFVYLDVAQLWGHPTVKAIRESDPKTIGEVIAQGKEVFGETPDNLTSATLFFPNLKRPDDTPNFGLVLAFKAPFDAARLKAGFDKVLPKDVKHAVHTPSDRLAVVLVGLGDEYARPRPAGGAGPLLPAIRDAATGKHVLVAGATLANLPDELRAADLPREVEPFRPLFKADAITARVDLGADITVDVRVKAQTPAQAVDAEKALGLLATLLQEQLEQGLKELDKDAKDPLFKDLLAVLKAGQKALQGTKFSTEGTEARAVVNLPADLPFVNAYTAATRKIRDAARAAQSSNNLKQIAIAMHGYHDVNNGFPPAAVCDKNGKPMLSWRVLILPYIEQNDLYQQFKLDEPWDSDHNKKLLAKMPNVYRLPTQKPDDTTTHYRVFVGNGAAFDYVTGHKLNSFADGTSNTIMVVTAAEAVPWSKPDELAFDPDKDMTKLLGTVVDGKAQAAFCDGAVRNYAKVPSQKTLNALITRNGGEIIDPDEP